jgi:hypothetical protein
MTAMIVPVIPPRSRTCIHLAHTDTSLSRQLVRRTYAWWVTPTMTSILSGLLLRTVGHGGRSINGHHKGAESNPDMVKAVVLGR